MSECVNGPTSTVPIGSVRVGRFIVGHNPICANSHISEQLDAEMREYFTDRNVLALYRRAEQLGVRTLMIRGDYRMLNWLELYRRQGGKMNVLAQTASEMHDIFANIRVLAAAGAEAIYHHGTQTDKFWRQGRIDHTLDYLKCMRDCGVAVGLCSHQPEVLDYAVQHDWDVDFYLASFYNISREARESSIVAGRPQYDKEHYLPEDREAMARQIRRLNRPVLAIKILAAGRHCGTQEQVREAFRYAFANLRPTDAVVVGLFPKHEDQLGSDLRYAEEAIRAASAAV
jgi:hypothetical protein